MADEELPQIEAIFPAPPPFYKHFTSTNLEQLRDTKIAAGISQSNENSVDLAALRLLELPPELSYLIPPAPPAEGKYRSFGAPWDLNEKIPTLIDLNIEQLFPDPPESEDGNVGSQPQWTLNRAFYLKKIVRSIMLNFLELVGILSINPEHAKDKLTDIEVLFLNAHHLINEYRPHQARESLILEMEEQLERKKAEIEDVRRMKEKIDALLAELRDDGKDAQESTIVEKTKTKEEEMREHDLAVWRALDAELAT